MTTRNSQSHPIRVDFLTSERIPELERLGMTFAPGKKQEDAATGRWDRDLELDLNRLSETYSADTLVSLIENQELESLGIARLVEKSEHVGIRVIRFPIPDVSTPESDELFVLLIQEIVSDLRNEKTVVVHCKGGLGRTGLAAACAAMALTEFSLSADEAIAMVRAARPRTIETPTQLEYIRNFDDVWDRHKSSDSKSGREEGDLDIFESEDSSSSNGKVVELDFSPNYRTTPVTLTPDEEVMSSRFKGCLLAGAVGDALGAAVEFDSLDRIRARFGNAGLTEYASAYGRRGAITDDTQMTLFTAEGLIRAYIRYSERGHCNPTSVVYKAYKRWLHTQRIHVPNFDREFPDYLEGSWLLDLPELNIRRAPGNTCLSALRSGVMGTIDEPTNNSKGCGGVMRVAPVGLLANQPFRLGAETAAITHGHPAGYLSAGVLAVIISKIVDGSSLADSVDYAVYEALPKVKNYQETYEALDSAVKLANDPTQTPSPEIVETLGGGWVGEEALAIAVYCSLVSEDDLAKALLLAVNHSGDSDSTGSIAGNILGALHGIDSIPVRWLERLELRNEIEQVATDLHSASLGVDLSDRYPGW